jgi:hypothetical protein
LKKKTLPQQTPYLEQYMLRSLMLVPPIHGGQVSQGIVTNGTDQWIRVEMAFGIKTGGKMKCICLYVVNSYGGVKVGNGSVTGGVMRVSGKSQWYAKSLLVWVHGGITSSLASAAYCFAFSSFYHSLTPKDPVEAITPL